MHTNIFRAFITLLRAGLWGTDIDDPDCFPLSKPEWEDILRVSVEQTVTAVVFDGIQLLEELLHPPFELKVKWVILVNNIEKHNGLLNDGLVEQLLFFKKFELHPFLLKGQGIAQLYRERFHRVCGDIDWYFGTKAEFKQANESIVGSGIQIFPQAGYSVNYQWKQIDIEHHQHFLDIHNPFLKGYLQELKIWSLDSYKKVLVRGVPLKLLNPIMQVVQVNTHILKHLLSFGIGIRQLCDSAILYSAYRDQMDQNLLKEIYGKLKILGWIDLLHQVLVDYLGLDPAMLPFELERKRSASGMMADIWTSGNFGFHDQRYNSSVGKGGKRKDSGRKLFSSFCTYFPVVPFEALSFPVTHLYSHLKKHTL